MAKSSFMEQKLLPAANKLASNKYLKAISNSFMSMIAFMTIGSIALVLISPPMDYTTMDPGFLCSFMKGWAVMADAIGNVAGPIYTICMECLSLFVAAGIGYFLGNQTYKMKGFIPVLVSVVSYLIPAMMDPEGGKTFDYLGGTGLFAALISSILSIELLRWLTEKKVGYISLEGQGVPEALTESFGMLIPVTIVLIVFGVIHAITVAATGSTFPALISTLLAPVLKATDSIWGGIVLVFLVMLFWWFGIHDSVITGPMGAFWATALAANISAYAAGSAGTQLPYVITEPFWWFFVMIGGSGATFGLVLLLLTVCKSKQLRTVGKLGIVPAFFNINEPVIFGVPLMMNPVMVIPFIGAPMANLIITYLCMAGGLVSHTVSYPGWNLFCPVAAMISTVDGRAFLLVLVLIVVDALIYLPFIKALDRQKLAEEQTAAAEN
jgi:PTS system cellobiose-specific IIC component